MDSKRLAALAVEAHLITQEQIDQCLREMEEIARGGVASVPLEEVLIAHGYVTRDQIDRLTSGAPSNEAAPTAPPPAALPPEVEAAMRDPRNRCGRYIRVASLGRGSLGAVWKCWDPPEGRFVAVKALNAARPPAEMHALLDDIRGASALQHPNIARVFEVTTAEDELSVAREYVEGRTLAAVRDASMTPKQAAEITRAVARALETAHAANVLHRDLNPRNIFLEKDGRVIITDFGQARRIELDPAAAPGPPEGDPRAGTPAYLAPERVAGRADAFSVQSDVYSIGAVLYFLLTGRDPFEGSSRFQICLRIVRDEPVPPALIDPQVPEDLERIVLHAMAKDPPRRYPTAAAMAKDLERFLGGGGISTDDDLRLSRGIAALASGQLEEAVHLFRELLAAATAQDKAAARDAILARIRAGEEGVTLAIERQKRNFDIRTQRGILRFARALIRSLDQMDPRADLKSAMDDFAKAAELRPEYPNARVNRANVMLFSGRFGRDQGKEIMPVFEMAMEDLTQAILADHTFAPAFHNRGIVHFYMGMELARSGADPSERFRASIADFNTAVKLESTNAYAYKDLGVVYTAMARYDRSGQRPADLLNKAIARLSQAIELQPKLRPALYKRATTYFALRRFQEAVADWERCLELDPQKRDQLEPLLAEARAKLKATS
ncbi:MAG: protein kinase [Planctomycetes bacterium]|nr:protein kinase [Planctomycetota bacterium]